MIFRSRDRFQDLLGWRFRYHDIPYETELATARPAASAYDVLRCMLTVLLNRGAGDEADRAFERLCNSFPCRFTAEDWKRVRRWRTRKDTDALQAPVTAAEGATPARHLSFYTALELAFPYIEDRETRRFLRSAYQVFDLAEASCQGHTVSELVRWILDRTDMVRRVLKAYARDFRGARFQMEGINKVLEVAEIFDGIAGGDPAPLGERLASFLKELTEAMDHMDLTGPGPEEPVRRSGVRLALVHEVQGETFRAVFLPCLAEGKFPAADTSLDSFPPDQRLHAFFRSHTEDDLPWPASQEERQGQERFLFEYALKRGTEKVFASVATEYDRRTAIPSRFFGLLQDRAGSGANEVSPEGVCSRRDLVRLLRNTYSRGVCVREVEGFLDRNPLGLDRPAVLGPLAALRRLPSRGITLAPDWVFGATDFRDILACRRSFFYRRLLRIPVEPGYVMNRGTFVHKVMERFYAQHGAPGCKPALWEMEGGAFEELLAKTVRQVAGEDLVNFEVTAEGLWCEEMLLAQAGAILWAEEEYLRCRGVTLPGELEFKFEGFEIEHDDFRVLVSGKVDRVSRDPSGMRTCKRTWVLDYKTGAPKDEETLRKECLGGDRTDPDTGLPMDLKDLQMPIYYLWAVDQGLPDPVVEVFYISYTKEGRVARRVRVAVGPQDLPRIRRHVVQAAQRVLAPGKNGASQFPRSADQKGCRNCAMNPRCTLIEDLRAHD